MFALVGAAACASEGESRQPQPSSTSELRADAAAAWAQIAEEAGAGRLADRKLIVVGVRGLDQHGNVHDTVAENAFDDVFVVLRANAPGLVFEASTHPFEKQPTRGVPDVDGDQKGDVGMVRPGVYRAARMTESIDDAPVFWVKLASGSDKLPAWRDTNHDGVVSSAERELSQSRNHTIDEVLFHVASDRAPKAVGCQVSTQSVLRSLGELAPSGFTYVIVDAHQLVTIPALDASPPHPEN